MHALPVERILNGLSGLLFIILGLVVLRVRASAPVNRAFALFAVSFGGAMMLLNLLIQVGHSTGPASILQASLNLAAVAGLLQLARLHMRATGSRWEALPALGAALLVAGWVAMVAREVFLGVVLGPGASTVVDPFQRFLADSASSYFLVVLSFGVALAGFTTGFASVDEETAAAKMRMGAALATFPAFVIGTTYAVLVDPDFGIDIRWEAWPVLAGLGLIVAAWIRNAARTTGRASAQARNVALLLLAATLAGILEQGLRRDAPDLAGYGITRVLCVVLLAYAIVRHQVMGIDLRMRWTISKSTIAAVFIAVFFIASETAQQFFGDTLGSTYVGIAAAGMLVFAMAPLQSVAERLARKAIPDASEGPTRPSTDPAHAYRVLLRRCLQDGSLSRDEEIALAHVATQGGLTPTQILRVRHEVEAELGVNGD